MAWLSFESLVNARDLGGTPTADGRSVQPGRLLRSDNLQDLTPADVGQLLELGLTDVIDLRSDFEVTREGPGPMNSEPSVRVHRYTFLPEADHTPLPTDDEEDVAEVAARALPWVGLEATVKHDNPYASHYLSYLADKPAQVAGALRTIAEAEGAVLVHCAAGKDRTGTTIALALMLVGAEEDAVIDDYALSSERMQLIIDRLSASTTYRENLAGRPLSSHMTRPDTMRAFIDHLVEEYGSVQQALQRIGWTDADTERLRAKLLD
ncbi:tyrosine-protein phosphatase [Naumannella halotolerans]|uniref:Protein tyrosine/serine phosphatase n=1 Tax=Naumannella halotolerans TaxID=993414 RepID=A0A4R7J490_9ACTN|nr:tyrosine-protein phosphatase [Naumannella halotolerans]TDT31159.1 protein tyrosine/serine phosphatase [Naumannella halotolerans]